MKKQDKTTKEISKLVEKLRDPLEILIATLDEYSHHIDTVKFLREENSELKDQNTKYQNLLSDMMVKLTMGDVNRKEMDIVEAIKKGMQD